MKWLKRKLRKWIREEDIYPIAEAARPVAQVGVDVEGLSFNVMPAYGGVILQTRRYDRKTDRNNYNTHIITDEEDLSTRVGQIVAMEILRHE